MHGSLDVAGTTKAFQCGRNVSDRRTLSGVDGVAAQVKRSAVADF